MKYVIAFVFAAALLPTQNVTINLGLFYLTPFKLSLILLAVSCVAEEASKKRQGRISFEKENRQSLIFMLLWLSYSMLSALWCRDIEMWMHGEYFLASGVVFLFLVEGVHLSWSEYKFILKSVLWVIILHNFIGWSEMMTHTYYFAPESRVQTMQIYEHYYPISMFSNPNDFVMVLILGLLLSTFFLLTEKGKKKILYVPVMVSHALLIYFTESRLGMAGMVAGVLWMVWIALSKRGRFILTGTVGSAFLLSVILIPGWYVQLGQNASKWIPSFLIRFVESSDIVRLNLVKNGLVFLIKSWGLGVGTGNTEYWMDKEPVFFVRGFTNMHNWWVEILTNFGVVIFVSYILFFLQLLYGMYRKYKSSTHGEVRTAGLIFQGFMVAFVLAGMSSSSNWVKEWLWLVWSFIIVFQGYKV